MKAGNQVGPEGSLGHGGHCGVGHGTSFISPPPPSLEAPSPLPAESKLFQLLQTFLLPSANSTKVAGVAVLTDMFVYMLDPDTWNLRICYPWVHQAMAEGDLVKLMSSFKLAMRNVIRFMHEMAIQVQAECEYGESCRRSTPSHQGGVGRVLAGGDSLQRAKEAPATWWVWRQCAEMPCILGSCCQTWQGCRTCTALMREGETWTERLGATWK